MAQARALGPLSPEQLKQGVTVQLPEPLCRSSPTSLSAAELGIVTPQA